MFVYFAIIKMHHIISELCDKWNVEYIVHHALPAYTHVHKYTLQTTIIVFKFLKEICYCCNYLIKSFSLKQIIAI